MSEEKRLTDKEIDGILKSGQVGFELAHRDDPRSIAALCRFAMDNRGYLRTLVNEIGALRLDLAAKGREIAALSAAQYRSGVELGVKNMHITWCEEMLREMVEE